MSFENIAEIAFSRTGAFNLYSEGSIEITCHDSQVVMRESEWKLLVKILSSIEGSGFKKICGGYNEELGKCLEQYAASFLEEQQ